MCSSDLAFTGGFDLGISQIEIVRNTTARLGDGGREVTLAAPANGNAPTVQVSAAAVDAQPDESEDEPGAGIDGSVESNLVGVQTIELVDNVRGMLPEVDYLTVHTPLTEETRHLVGKPELAILKRGVRLVNCARGGIYDEAALVEGLKSGVIGGVALDVFEKEPCTESPLFGMPGVVVTPHLGASTEEAQSQVAVEGVGLLVDFFSTGTIRHSEIGRAHV